MRKKTSIAAVGLLSLAGLLAAGVSNASPIVFQTAPGATTSGGPVSASASFSMSSPGSLQITLNDTLANPNNVGQLLSGLSFSIPGFTTGTLTNSSSTDVFVTTGGAYNLGTPGTTTGWILQSGFDLCDICSSGKGVNAPAGLIIGPPASSNLYANANGSIVDNSAHNPFLYETATYDLSISGLPSNFTVSSVLFRFGTTFGTDTSVGECTSSGCSSTVPEPGALALFAAGLGALGFALSYKRRRAARQR
jgi:hypothetical protein